MTDKRLREKHPELWASVYDTTRDEMRDVMLAGSRLMKNPTPERIIERVAHNAAFMATLWCEDKCPMAAMFKKRVVYDSSYKGKKRG
jgi:hypothetical protein